MVLAAVVVSRWCCKGLPRGLMVHRMSKSRSVYCCARVGWYWVSEVYAIRCLLGVCMIRPMVSGSEWYALVDVMVSWFTWIVVPGVKEVVWAGSSWW